MDALEFKQLVKESIREVLREERLKLCLLLMPRVSDKEMQTLQAQLGKPAEYDSSEFINLTDWVKHGPPSQ
ncbi:MAG: hypothetical protein EA367_13675 [Leptolyngbya sp. DLM2.Bin15]|nr:MAG: hypothetical protein EA367_13675 [Leptolyngbya sp. DLM2.Bin15]